MCWKVISEGAEGVTNLHDMPYISYEGAVWRQPAAKCISNHSDKTLAYTDICNARLSAEVFLIPVVVLRRIQSIW